MPVNGTEWDSIALQLVLPLARAAQAEVTLLRVVESVSGWLDLDLESSELARAVAYMDGLAAACAGTGVAVRTLVECLSHSHGEPDTGPGPGIRTQAQLAASDRLAVQDRA